MEKYYIEVASDGIICKLIKKGDVADYIDFKVTLHSEGLAFSFRGNWLIEEPDNMTPQQGLFTWDTILSGRPKQELRWCGRDKTVVCKVFDESFRRFWQALEKDSLDGLAELFSESENDIFLDLAASLAYRQGCSNPAFRRILYDDILQNLEDGMKDNI